MYLPDLCLSPTSLATQKTEWKSTSLLLLEDTSWRSGRLRIMLWALQGRKIEDEKRGREDNEDNEDNDKEMADANHVLASSSTPVSDSTTTGKRDSNNQHARQEQNVGVGAEDVAPRSFDDEQKQVLFDLVLELGKPNRAKARRILRSSNANLQHPSPKKFRKHVTELPDEVFRKLEVLTQGVVSQDAQKPTNEPQLASGARDRRPPVDLEETLVELPEPDDSPSFDVHEGRRMIARALGNLQDVELL